MKQRCLQVGLFAMVMSGCWFLFYLGRTLLWGSETSFHRHRTVLWNMPDIDRGAEEVRLLPAVGYAQNRTILLWNPFWQDKNWGFKKLGSTPFDGCQHKCILTADRRDVGRARLVLFHCVDRVDAWPKVRPANQIYAVYCWEPPTYANLDKLNHRMNITVTYRMDSDIPQPALRVIKMKTPSTVPIKFKTPFSNRTKSVVWLVSNCGAKSGRDVYVQQLQNHIDVDIFGKCGKLKCPKTRFGQCLEIAEKNYKFYIAFENNICNGYVTEKLRLPLTIGVLPIVMGGANYEQIAPPRSYINVKDFASPKALADYLHYLSKNETAYNSYFKWRDTHTVEIPNQWCDMCAKMSTEPQMLTKPATDIATWWRKGACDNGLIRTLIK